MSKILIVDDDEDLAVIVREFLTAQAYTVELAHCIEDAFAILSHRDFDLLILDWEIRERTGLEICKGYRDKGGDAGIIMLTGRSSSADKVAGLAAGADDYLTKPFDMEEFSARVAAILRRTAQLKRTDVTVFDQSWVGKTFASCYEIESVIGTGAMGIVYKAVHNKIKRTAAIKVLSDKNISPDSKRRFEREAKAMSLLNHPQLIRIYDYGVTPENTPYIIMEFIEGNPLSVLIKSNGPLQVKDALPLFIQIAEGLEHAHLQSIIHRDLKPSNIMISADTNTAKILDFGVVKIEAKELGADVNLTFAGEIFGSPGYMSPEQGTNKNVDNRSDLYSFACVMYEVLTGSLPFTAYSFVELMNAKINSKPPSICAKFPASGFSAELDHIISKALEPDPSRRQNSVSELKQELLNLQTSMRTADLKSSKIMSYFRNILGKKE